MNSLIVVVGYCGGEAQKFNLLSLFILLVAFFPTNLPTYLYVVVLTCCLLRLFFKAFERFILDELSTPSDQLSKPNY